MRRTGTDTSVGPEAESAVVDADESREWDDVPLGEHLSRYVPRTSHPRTVFGD